MSEYKSPWSVDDRSQVNIFSEDPRASTEKYQDNASKYGRDLEIIDYPYQNVDADFLNQELTVQTYHTFNPVVPFNTRWQDGSLVVSPKTEDVYFAASGYWTGIGYIIKNNKNNQNIWQKQIGKSYTSPAINKMSLDSEDNLIFSDATSVFKLNKDGELLFGIDLWTLVGVTDRLRAYAVDVGKDDNIYISGNFGANQFVSKINKNGQILWTKYLSYNFSSNYIDVRVDNDLNIIIVAAAVILKIDSDGNILWRKQLDESSNNIDIDLYNNIYIGMNNALMKLDKNGNVVWSKQLTYPNIGIIRGISVYNNNLLVVSEQFDTRKALISKFSLDGVVKDIRFFDNFRFPTNIVVVKNKVYVSGTTQTGNVLGFVFYYDLDNLVEKSTTSRLATPLSTLTVGGFKTNELEGLRSIHYSNFYKKTFVGRDGTAEPFLKSSTNNSTWSSLDVKFKPSLSPVTTIASNENILLVGGTAGRISISNNSTQWSPVVSNFAINASINKIAYGNNFWVAVGDVGTIRSSSNGIIWTTVNSNFGNSSIVDVAFGNNIWVAVGGGQIRTSTNTTTWTTVTSNFGSTLVYSVEYGNGIWVASEVNAIRYSTDTITWITGITPGTFFSIKFANDLWLASGRPLGSQTAEEIYTSTNGISWISSNLQSQILDTGPPSSGSLTHDGNNFLAVFPGNQYIHKIKNDMGLDLIKTASINQIYSEVWRPINKSVSDIAGSFQDLSIREGDPWKTYAQLSTGVSSFVDRPVTSLLLKKPQSLSFDDHRAVMGTEVGNIYKFDDAGGNFTAFTPSSVRTYTGSSKSIFTIANNGNVSVFANESGQIYRSTDSINWLRNISNLEGIPINSIAYGNNLWVAVGNSGQIRTSTDALVWSTVTSNFGSSTIYSVIYENSLWVATGVGGSIRKSTDGLIWSTIVSNTTKDLGKIAYFDNSWIVGSINEVFLSQDSNVWTGRPTPFTSVASITKSENYISLVGVSNPNRVYYRTHLDPSKDKGPIPNFGATTIRSVAYGNSLWVAVGDSGQLRASTNATAWTTVTSNFGATAIQSISYGNNLWVAGGNAGQIRTSTNTITWTTVTSNFGSTAINIIVYGNNLWVAAGNAGQLRTSTDAITWITVNSNMGSSIVSIEYGNQIWLAGSETGDLVKSTNATTWETVSSNFSSLSFYRLIYSNNIWLLAGLSGTINTSRDRLFWASQNSNFGSTVIRAVGYGNGLWVAGGQFQIRTSTDTITWITANSNFAPFFIRSLSYGNSLWIVTGDSGQIRTSTDGTVWTTVTSNFGSTTITDIAYGNNLWTAVGNAGQVRTSTDGTVWTTVTSNFGSTAITNIAYGNNLWTAVGNAGQIRTSTDTTTWTTVNSNFGITNILSIVYSNNLWLAGGASGQLRTSTDTITWVTVSSNFGDTSIESISYGDNTWIAVGVSGQIRESTNATVWTTISTPTFRSIKYGDDKWIAGGLSGKMYGSSDTVLWTTINSTFGQTNIININFKNNLWIASGNSGQSRSSTDAISWTTITTNFVNNFISTSDYGNSSPDQKWVFAGQNGIMTTSTDGITWDLDNTVWQISNTDTLNFTLESIKYANNLWVLGGNGQTEGLNLATSTDLISWTTRNSGFPPSDLYQKYIYAIDYNSVWLAGGSFGELRYSTDAITWLTTNYANSSIRALDYYNNLWIASQGNDILTSTNNTSWFNITNDNILNLKTVTAIENDKQKMLFGLNDGNGVLLNVPTYLDRSSFARSSASDIQKAVIVGTFGSIIYSTDLSQWTPAISNFSSTVNSVAYGNLWIAGGNFGQIESSADGINWSTTVSNFANFGVFSVNYGNGLWLAGGASGQLRTSTDAITWTTVNSNFGNTSINSIAYGNNLWVAVGNSGQIRTSTDAMVWTARTSNFGTLGIAAIDYGNELWIAGGTSGQVRKSTNGISWTTVAHGILNSSISSIKYENGWYIAAADGRMINSTDSITWNEIFTNFSNRINLINKFNNVWYVSGEGEFGPINYSTDLLSWTSSKLLGNQIVNFNFSNNSVNEILFKNDTWVAVGNNGKISNSTDAITWISQNSNFSLNKINSVDYGDNLWIAVGDSGQIRRSTDLVIWTTVTSWAGTNNLNGVSYGVFDGIPSWYIAGSGGIILKSTDGISWIERYSFLSDVTKLKFNEQWAISTQNGRVLVYPPIKPTSKNYAFDIV